MPTVTLKQPHTHAGKNYPKGATLSLSRQEAEFLLARKVIDVLPAASEPDLTTTETPDHE